jgi:Flp pilus assembly protein TadD
MIGAPEKLDVRDTTPKIEFRMEPIAHNPLVPTAPVLFKREGEDVTVEWPNEAEHLQPLGSDQIIGDVIERSQRDVKKHPRSSRALTNLGLAFLVAGKLDDAMASFREALQLDSQNYVAATSLAKTLVSRGRFDEAEQLYRSLARTFPSAATPLMSLAHLAMRRSDFAAAERIMRDVIKLGTKSPVPHYQLATVLIRSRRVHEAIKELRAAIGSDVRSPSLYQALGVAYALAGDNAKSSRAFKSALALSPALSDAVRGLANTLLNLGNADSTIELLTTYLEGKPEDAQARILLGRAYAQKGKHAFSRGHFLQAFNLVDGNARLEALKFELANDIGASFFFERDLKQAEHWFSRAIEFGPRNGPLPYKNLARTFVDLEQYEAALHILRRCRALFGEDKDASSMSAHVHGVLGAYDIAISELAPLLSRDDCDAGVFASLGCYLADGRHDFSGARDVLRQAYEKFPDNFLIINNLAYVYLMMEDIAAARELLERHHTQPGTNVMLTATWGLLYLKEGHKQEARTLYTEAAKLASLEGHRNLAETVKQKMHLEFATDFLKRGDRAGALNEVNLGLKAGKGRLAYGNDLIAIKLDIERQAFERK